ncbi:hypothetical protein BUH_7043 [Burkholderia pseudomallei Pakistan 9]|nr:hypothetical protein BUH_7043 [Burkholderia pseudomallei Pakistan 9]
MASRHRAEARPRRAASAARRTGGPAADTCSVACASRSHKMDNCRNTILNEWTIGHGGHP